MTPLAAQAALILFCFVAAGFFAGMETGIISINRLRLLHRARNGSAAARIIERFLRESDRLLGTTLVGVNICTVVISTLTARIAEQRWGRWGQGATSLAVALALLVFSEYLPKAWFSSRPLERCLPLAPLLLAADRLCRPVAALALFLTRWASPGHAAARPPFVTREHLQLLTRDSEAGGQISTLERLMIHRVLDLQLQTAGDILTPLGMVARVRDTATVREAIEAVRRQGHLKVPVFSADDTACVGVLYMQDVLARQLDWDREPVTAHMHPPFFIAHDVRADDVLPLLRHNRQHIAFVRDDNGRVLGIVTVENVLKILVGNLPPTATGDRRADRSAAVVAAPLSAGDGAAGNASA